MITRDLTITVNNNTASLSEPLTIYRYDRGIVLNLKIVEYKFKFNRLTEENVLRKNTSLMYARVLVHKPQGTTKDDEDKNKACFEVPLAAVGNDTVIVTIDQTWTDSKLEEGTYQLQIQLYGENPMTQRVTIPPVSFQVEPTICDSLDVFSDADGDGYPDNLPPAIVGEAMANLAVITEEDENGEYYNSDYANGVYNRTQWNTGDIITSNSLNKMEHAIDYSIGALSDVGELKEEVSTLTDNLNTVSEEVSTLSDNLNTVSEEIENINNGIGTHTHEGMLTSTTASQVEFVTSFPSTMKPGVLYILVEEV